MRVALPGAGHHSCAPLRQAQSPLVKVDVDELECSVLANVHCTPWTPPWPCLSWAARDERQGASGLDKDVDRTRGLTPSYA